MPDTIVVRADDETAAYEPRSYAHKDITPGDVSALESRADVAPKEWLLAERRKLMKELAPLAAFHRSNGQSSPASEARKRHRDLVATEIRDTMQGTPSEALLERLANASEKHRAFCKDLEAKSLRYQVLAAEKEEIEYRLRARETELNAFCAELRAGV